MIELLIMAGIFGACMGSFLNVVSHRSLQNKSWWGNERSICENCGHVLSAFELIPVVSWLIQKGRCRHCGEKISVRYILVEIICAFMAVMIFSRWKFSFACILAGLGACSIIVNSLTDIEAGDVFDIFALSPGAVALILRVAGGGTAIFDGVSGAFAGFGFFALIIILSRGGMGWGDATFMAGMGAVMGLRFTCLAIYIGLMVGGFLCVALMLIGKIKLGKKTTMPLVPFLSFGCFVTIIFGTEILAYLDKKLFLPEILFSLPWPWA